MEKIKVNMSPNPLDVQTIHASQNDGEARQWEFELHNNGELIDTSNVTEQMFFKSYKGGTEQLLPENGSTPTTSPFLGDIRYPQGLLTDQEFTYRQSPTESDGLAKIKSIKGNTLVWNQQIPIPTSQSGASNGVTVTNNGDGSLTLNGTPSNMNINWWIWGNYATNVSILSLKASHKYFVKDCNLYRETGAELLTQYIGESPVIWSPSANYELGGVRVNHGDTNKTYTNVKIYPMIIDITQMGLDSITDPAEFISLFPLPYYQHDAGSLLSFNGSGLKTTNADNTVESTLTLPISTYFPTGMKSAGSAYDELTPSKAITRLIRTIVDGTNKTAIYYGKFNNHQLFYIDLFASEQSSDMDGMAILSNHYTTVNTSSMGDRCIRYQGSLPSWSKGRIYWTDDRYTSASAMNTALQSDPLEIISLAQAPTETSFTTASLVTENAEIPLSNEDGVLIGKCTEELSAEPGFHDAKIKLSDSDGTCYSNKLQLHVERSPQ